MSQNHLATHDCLTERKLEAIADGSAWDGADRLHAEQCPACKQKLADIRQNLEIAKEIAGAQFLSESPKIDSISDVVPGFNLLSQIARGGQGIIYKAVQQSTHRKVAVKVLLAGGFASDEEQARFRQEIDLASRLRHPHIITVYESGETTDGRPYLAMEYIHGQSVDEYVRQHAEGDGFDTKDLLALFAKICDAINHGHQRGVIHRDIKPSNILVNDDGEPFVLDFGLAKAAAGTHHGTPTLTGEFKGTIAYASPEQVAGDPRDIDTRTDVYSLGVVLYELLTGRFPYPTTTHTSATLRHILETSPETPTSDRFTIDEDVATILMRILSKDRQRRYQTAGDLAADIRSYLSGEPIAAKRDKMWYVLRKKLHWTRVASMLAVTFALVGFATGALLAGVYYRASLEASKEAEMFRQMVAASTDAILAVDVETSRILEVNPACTKLMLWTRDELLEMTILQISDEPAETWKALQKQGAGEQTLVKGRRCLRKDGSKFIAELQLGAFKWKGKKTVVAIFRDVTHRESP